MFVSMLIISEMLFYQDVISTEKEEGRKHVIELFSQKLEAQLM